MGVDAMIEGLELVRAGVKLKHPQNLADGSYESWFKKDVAEIDWAKPVAEIYNLIRAANPAPGAWGTIKGQKVDIFDSAKVAGSGAPGEVLAIDDQGMTIAAGGGAILAKRVRGADGKKVAGRRVGEVGWRQRRRQLREAAQRRKPPLNSQSISRELRRREDHGCEVRHRDRARSEEEADHGDRRQARHPDRASAALRPRQGEDLGRVHRLEAEAARTAS